MYNGSLLWPMISHFMRYIVKHSHVKKSKIYEFLLNLFCFIHKYMMMMMIMKMMMMTVTVIPLVSKRMTMWCRNILLNKFTLNLAWEIIYRKMTLGIHGLTVLSWYIHASPSAACGSTLNYVNSANQFLRMLNWRHYHLLLLITHC